MWACYVLCTHCVWSCVWYVLCPVHTIFGPWPLVRIVYAQCLVACLVRTYVRTGHGTIHSILCLVDFVSGSWALVCTVYALCVVPCLVRTMSSTFCDWFLGPSTHCLHCQSCVFCRRIVHAGVGPTLSTKVMQCDLTCLATSRPTQSPMHPAICIYSYMKR